MPNIELYTPREKYVSVLMLRKRCLAEKHFQQRRISKIKRVFVKKKIE